MNCHFVSSVDFEQLVFVATIRETGNAPAQGVYAELQSTNKTDKSAPSRRQVRRSGEGETRKTVQGTKGGLYAI